MATKITLPTEAQVELMTGKQLADTFNSLADEANLPPVKKFSDRPAGIKRVLQAIAVVEMQRTKNKVPEVTKKAVKAQAAAAKAPKDPGKPKVTITSVAKAAILAGDTNEKVWAKLQNQFGLPDSRKNYPAWYRAAMKRSGELA